MNTRALRLAVMMAFATVAASAHAQAGDWGDLAVVSSTLGNNANRLCLGVPASMRPADMGCPTYAPYVSTNGNVGIGTAAPSSTVHLSSDSVNPFLNITRIIPGVGVYTTALGRQSLEFTSNQSFHIKNGFNYIGNLHTNAQVWSGPVGITGVPTTGTISFTPSTTLHVSGTLRLADGNEACDANRAGGIRYTSSSVFQFCMGSGWQNLADAAGGGQADRITSGTTNVIATEDRSVTISTAGSQRVTIGENGNVGIGMIAPTSRLVVEGNSGGLVDINAGNNNVTSALSVKGVVSFDSGLIGKVPLSIFGRAGQTAALFRVGTQQSSQGDLLIVAASGNVGIGTSAPSATLEIRSGANSVGVGGGGMALSYAAGGGYRHWIKTKHNAVANSPGNAIEFYINNAVTPEGSSYPSSSGNRMALGMYGDGNVGIGTSAPSATLTVSGSAIISGTIQVAGTATETCTAGKLGTIRFNPVTGAPQICVQR